MLFSNRSLDGSRRKRIVRVFAIGAFLKGIGVKPRRAAGPTGRSAASRPRLEGGTGCGRTDPVRLPQEDDSIVGAGPDMATPDRKKPSNSARAAPARGGAPGGGHGR